MDFCINKYIWNLTSNTIQSTPLLISDIRLKKDIGHTVEPLNLSLDKICQLQGAHMCDLASADFCCVQWYRSHIGDLTSRILDAYVEYVERHGGPKTTDTWN